MKKQSGFTLIEVIVSLILFAIISVIAGMGIVEITESYVSSRNNVEMAQKVQMAMTRMNLELMFIDQIKGATGSSIEFDSSRTGFRTYIEYAPDEGITFRTNEDGAQTKHPLIANEDLGAYNGRKFIQYFKSDGNAWTFSSNTIDELAYIDLLIVFKRTDGNSIDFIETVDIRNNGNANNALPNI